MTMNISPCCYALLLVLLLNAGATSKASGEQAASALSTAKSETNGYLPWDVQRLYLQEPIQYRKVLPMRTYIARETIGVVDIYINKTTGKIQATEVIEAPSGELGNVMRSEVQSWSFIPVRDSINRLVKVTVAFYFSKAGNDALEVRVANSGEP